MTVSRRSENPGDEAFLRRLILETIAGELGASAWPEPLRSHLLGIQYAARRHARSAELAHAESQVVQADGKDCGWIVLASLPDEMRLVEIMIAPEFRGRGIGTAAIREVQTEAADAGKPVTLHVNVMNAAAIRLYERLGFRRVDGDEVQQFMKFTKM